MIVEIVIVIVLAITAAYFTVLYTGQKGTYQGTSAMYDMSKPTMVLQNSNMPWSAKPCSLRFAIFIENSPRTVARVDCVDSSTPTSLAPSCEDYSFIACHCNDIGCSNCSLVDVNSGKGGYLSKILYTGDLMELWTSGYTSQNDKPYIPALLKIKTAKDASNFYMETVSLPAIPLQKWTIITIVKEGRRIDVYYGEKSVASSYCKYVPVPATLNDNTYAGNAGWKGSMGLFYGMTKEQTSEDVENDVKSLVDTRGTPLYFSNLSFSFDVNMPTGCMLGNCNALPVIKPRNPFAVYSSNVS